jgi:hypothetical protein
MVVMEVTLCSLLDDEVEGTCSENSTEDVCMYGIWWENTRKEASRNV